MFLENMRNRLKKIHSTHKKIEEIPQESEIKYSKFIEISSDAVFLADVETRIILEANKNCEVLLGIPVEEIVGMNYMQVYLPEDVECNKNLFDKHAQTEKSTFLENIFVQHKGGQKIPVEISSSVFKLGGKMVVLGIFRDVTSCKRIEKELKTLNESLEQRVVDSAKLSRLNEELQTENTEHKRMEKELQKRNEDLEQKVGERTKELKQSQEQLISKEKQPALDQAVLSVVREIRNLMASIYSSTNYIERCMRDADKRMKTHTHLIKEQARISNDIINNLIDLIRPKSPSMKDSDINAVIKLVLTDFKVPENIIINTQLDKNLPVISMDYAQIMEVFNNIVSNSIQAMPEGGKLEVKTGVENDCIVIKFEDTGDGIPDKDIKEIFKPLYTTRARRMGLGLAITKNIIDGLKGRVEVKSEVGEGTTFIVNLPIEPRSGSDRRAREDRREEAAEIK